MSEYIGGKASLELGEKEPFSGNLSYSKSIPNTHAGSAVNGILHMGSNSLNRPRPIARQRPS